MPILRTYAPPILSSQITRDKLRNSLNKALLIALFVTPGMAVFLIFLLLPVLGSVRYSLYKWDGFGPLTNYVALDNYERLYHHNVFRLALQHSFMLMGMSITIQLPIALAIALLVGRGNLPGSRIFRLLLFVPYVFSEPLTAIIWLYVLHPQSGLANLTLDALLPGTNRVAWLGDRDIVLYSVFGVLTWKYFGFYMILYMAGLQNVNRDLEEAARVDGANWRQVLWKITLPLMGNTIRLTVFLSVLGSFQQFVTIWVLTQGGPVNGSEVLATYLYKYGIQRFNLGYGSAVAVILFMITLVFSLGYQRLVMRQDYAAEVF
jgi:raffinose/stachyose/melibiose transport system permease protein